MAPKAKKRPKTAQPSTDFRELTTELVDVSVTERGQFRTCRRRWELQVLRGLVPRSPALALEFGTIMHTALETFYLSTDKRDERYLSARTAYEKAYREVSARLEADGATGDELDEFHELYHVGQSMLENYCLRFDKSAKVQLGRPIAVEGVMVDSGEELPSTPPKGYKSDTAVIRNEAGRMWVPIVDPITKRPVPAVEVDGELHQPMLSARIDLITERKTPKKGLWVDDHKTATSPPSDRGLDFDDQATGYCYTVWRLTGTVPRGVVWNVLIKNEPSDPRVLKDGSLSTAKDQRTTPDLYRAALKEHGLLIPGSGRIATDEHAACMEALLAKGWDPFFRRFEVTRTEHELLSYEARLFEEYEDMWLAKEAPEKRYPNPSIYLCPQCSVKTICAAMEDGSDPEGVIEAQYVVGPDRKATK